MTQIVSCNECKLEVASKAALKAHWQKERENNNRHYHCQICVRLFHTPEAESRHRREFHPAKQDLGCPGCNERFGSAGSLMEHIEKNRCKKIKNDDYAARREEKLAFARELQRRHRGEDVQLPGEDLSVASLSLDETTTNKKEPYNFTQFLSRAKDIPAGVPSLSSLRPEAEKTIQPNPVTFAMKKEERPQVVLKKSEYPQLGSKLADLPTGRAGQKGDNKAGNAWGQGKKLFPDAPPAVRPGPEVLQKPAPASEPMEAAWPEHDPRNPLWDPSVYYVTYSNKYKCPIDRCPKSFPHVAGLRGHLLSAKHAGLLKVQCPTCCKWFDSMAALVTHASSQSVRCNVRHTDGYRQFLDQLTAGIVDTTEKHSDGTEKYAVPEEARAQFGTLQGRWMQERY